MIVDFLFSIFGENTIYIKFSSELIHIRYAEKNRIIEEKPIIAVSKAKNRHIVVAVGKECDRAQSKDPSKIQVYNAFKHPRTFLSNFEFAEATLRDDSVTIYVQKGNNMARVLYKLDALLKNTLRQDFFKKYIV